MTPAFALRQRAIHQPNTPHAAGSARRPVSPCTLPATPRSPRALAARAALSLAALLLALLATLTLGTGRALAQQVTHIVTRGEKLAQIARSYGVSLEQIVEANELTNPNHIWVGQPLVIPGAAAATGGTAAYANTSSAGGSSAGASYTVRAGDTLSEIAKQFGVTQEELLRLNGLDNPRFIWVGQELLLGSTAGSSTGSSTGNSAGSTATSAWSGGGGGGSVYVVQAGDTLSEIARDLGVSMQQLIDANGLPNASHVWVGQRLYTESPALTAAALSAMTPDGVRSIEVDLGAQTLTAWQGDVAVLHTSISSGLSGTPTVTGHYQVGTKYQSQRMRGQGYDIPDVPWVMYFYGSYAIHGAYWHNNFGVPMSRGCVNASVGDAEFLYNWAPAGTEVWVHD